MADPVITPAWLRAQRRARDWSQQALAEAVGYSVEMIRKVEQGQAAPSPKLQRLLAHTFSGALPVPPPAPAVGFGAWLRARRTAADQTQAALAAQVGCTPGTLKRIEQGTLRPSRQLAGLLLAALAVPPADQPGLLDWARGVPVAPAGPVPAPRGNLPAALNAFVGRDAEITALATLLGQPAVRLVTLTGPGGVGKTRLAQQVAATLHPAFPDGIWWIDLAPLRDPTGVLPALAEVLGVPESAGQTLLPRVQQYLQARRALLVFDNWEHLLPAAPLLRPLLEAAPDVRVLTTSRAPLQLTGEHEYLVAPLTLTAVVPDGVWTVALPPEGGSAAGLTAISQTLGVPETAGMAVADRLAAYLRARRLLIVLDDRREGTAEWPVELAATLTTLGAQAPGVQIVVTDGQQLWAPEADPTPAADLLTSPAVALFLRRAQAVQPLPALDRATVRIVAAICARLDGLPLALELAAGRSKQFPPAALLRRLDARLALLGDGPRDQPARHQTLRALLDWSYDLLPATAQTLLAECSVFAGGWTAAAAAAVCTYQEAVAAAETALLHLVNQSLLYLTRQPDGTARFQMLETVREYAAQQLAARGGTERGGTAHSAYFTTLAAAQQAQLRGPHQAAALYQLRLEHENLRTALRWTTGQAAWAAAAQLGVALWRFWQRGGYWSEGRVWLEAIQAHAADLAPATQADLLEGLGGLIYEQGDLAQARIWLTAGLTQRRALDDSRGIAALCNQLSLLVRRQGDRAAAHTWLAESLARYRAAADAAGTAETLHGLAVMARSGDDWCQAQQHYRASLILFEQLGDVEGTARVLLGLAVVVQALDGPTAGQSLLAQSLAAYRRLDDPVGITRVLTAQANALRLQEQVRAAQGLHEEVLTIQRALGSGMGIALAQLNLGQLAEDQGDWPTAIAHYTASLAGWRELGNKVFEGAALLSLGDATRAAGRAAEATAWYQGGLRLAEQAAGAYELGWACWGLGHLARDQGKYGTARTHYVTSLRHYSTGVVDELGVARVLVALAALALLEDRPAQAQRIYAAARPLNARLGLRRDPADRAEYQRVAALLLSQGGADPAGPAPGDTPAGLAALVDDLL